MIYQRVLVPVSGKNSGERAAKALRHAKTLCSGEIILLHVTEALPNLVGGAAHTELERSNTAKAETLLAPLADALKKEGVACRYIVREGLTADTIVTVGHEEGVDMGSSCTPTAVTAWPTCSSVPSPSACCAIPTFRCWLSAASDPPC